MEAFENNWRQKSIENLEKDYWGPPPKDSTPLVDKVHHLRAMQIEKLEVKDIRLLIGQGVGLKFLIPLALDILRDDLFTEAEFYPGDLLQKIMNVDDDFWANDVGLKVQVEYLLKSYTDDDKEKFRKGKFGQWT